MSNIIWGNTVADYVKIGISAEITNITPTEATVSVGVWFASKYSVEDADGNYLYLDASSSPGSATTFRGDTAIYTYNDSGSGWSEENILLLTGTTYTFTFNREVENSTKYIYAKLAGLNWANWNDMFIETTIIIPAKEQQEIITFPIRIYNQQESKFKNYSARIFHQNGFKNYILYKYNGVNWVK